jgi:hypothetical protein
MATFTPMFTTFTLEAVSSFVFQVSKGKASAKTAIGNRRARDVKNPCHKFIKFIRCLLS